jgi:hypothetical protein
MNGGNKLKQLGMEGNLSISTHRKQPPFIFTVEEKFAGLRGPALYSELGLYKMDGPEAPYIPLRLLKGSLNVGRMDEEERAFFLWWRGEFRRGNIHKADEGYIRVYARELCLFAGGNGETLEADFGRLLALWENYAEKYPDIGEFLPRWLMDYAVIYEITDFCLPLLVSRDSGANDPLLADIRLYKRFIEESNVIEYDDVKPLLHKAAEVKSNSQTASDFCLALNTIDRYLREVYQKKLFEFFLPPNDDTEKRSAFKDMEKAGSSTYAVQGPRFSKHFPLIDFLEKTFAYTEYVAKVKNDDNTGGNPPELADIWKRLVNAALGFNLGMKEADLKMLRAESDAVRQMLAVENGAVIPEIAAKTEAFTVSAKPARKKISLKSFLRKLDKDGREVLRIITGVKSQASLDEFAIRSGVMPELLIDRVNSLFMELSGDLLICTVDEKPDIEQEYKAELLKALQG